MRQSIPTGWTEDDWDTDAEVASVVGQITSPGSVTVTWDGSQEPGGDPDTMPAGVYSFDIFAREYDDVASETRELLDETGFKTPYATWVAELDSWIAVDEEGNAELRVKYMFTDDYDRGAVGDAHVTVLGPDLKELAVVDVPTATGVLHGGEDNDGDGEADGIAVYAIGSGDSGGEVRIVMLSGQVCILSAARAALGAPPRNQPGQDDVPVYYAAGYTYISHFVAGDEDLYGDFWEYARARSYCKRKGVVEGPSIRANYARTGMQKVHLVFIYSHGKLKNGAAVGVLMAHPGLNGLPTLLLGDRQYLSGLTGYSSAWPLNGTVKDPISWTEYADLERAFVVGCRTYYGSGSFCEVLRDQTRGDVAHVIGTTVKLHGELAVEWTKYFLSEAKTHTWAQAMSTARSNFWGHWVPRIQKGLSTADSVQFQEAGLELTQDNAELWQPPYPDVPTMWRYNDTTY